VWERRDIKLKKKLKGLIHNRGKVMISNEKGTDLPATMRWWGGKGKKNEKKKK